MLRRFPIAVQAQAGALMGRRHRRLLRGRIVVEELSTAATTIQQRKKPSALSLLSLAVADDNDSPAFPHRPQSQHQRESAAVGRSTKRRRAEQRARPPTQSPTPPRADPAVPPVPGPAHISPRATPPNIAAAQPDPARVMVVPQPVPAAEENSVRSMLIRRGEFGRLEEQASPGRLSLLRRKIDGCSMLSYEQALDCRGWLLKEKVMISSFRARSTVRALARGWDEGVSLAALSRKHDLAPMTILRALLERRLGSKRACKDALNDPAKLTSRERADFERAQSDPVCLDICHLLDDGQQLEAADAFEDEIAGLLRGCGVQFETQEQLIATQVEELGRAVATPDFRILSSQQKLTVAAAAAQTRQPPQLMINGRTLHWLEAKNFYGCGVRMLQKAVARQSGRYVDRFGDGALVFRGGFSSKIAAGVASGVHVIGIEELTSALQRWQATHNR